MQRLGITLKLTLVTALLASAPIVYLVFHEATQDMSDMAMRRMKSCQQLAIDCARDLQQRNYTAIRTRLDGFRQRNLELKGVRLKRFDGYVIHDSCTDALAWHEFQQLSDTSFTIPLVRGSQQWGVLEATYSVNGATKRSWAVGKAFGYAFLFNFMAVGMLLRRSLAVLDTSKVVPRRVRNTLDTIAGGVAITDLQGRLIMVNDAFAYYTGRTREALIGTTLSAMPFVEQTDGYPWDIVLKERERQSGVSVELDSDGTHKTFVVNATPIFDAQEELAGALVSFEDVTTLESKKQSLVSAMAELQASKDQIHLQNVRLQELASRDALTGCFNRRMLMEHLESRWISSLKTDDAVHVVMLDVDHFKRLNDSYGHAVGDDVLKDVARILQESAGDVGFVGRYGGEEFCIILSDMILGKAIDVAEGVRRSIQHHFVESYGITASFGVSSSLFGAASYQSMLEQADQALYAAKQSGRNTVKLWTHEMSGEGEVSIGAVCAVPQAIPKNALSYQAVAALHSALAYRDAETALHSQRVSELCVTLGRNLMSISDLYVLEIAGLLHDIGKIGVPDSVLLKPGKLTADEWKIMEAHTPIGVEIVHSAFQFDQLTDMVRYHHHRYDGALVPAGQPIGKDMPLGARIISIVDAYDAMVSNRVYRKGRSPEEAFDELRRCAGTQFDPELVERFISLKIGWRPDSRYMTNDIDDDLAISVGHLTERTIAAFESHDVKSLAESLHKLKQVAKTLEHPGIVYLADELSKNISGRSVDWDLTVPILQNLLDLCLTIQRAHIRDVASRPQVTPNCPQEAYYRQARGWDSGKPEKREVQ